MKIFRYLTWATLGFVARSIPFSYTVNILQYANLSGTFEVSAGGISPKPKYVGPVSVSYAPDPRVSLSGATLNYEVCFTSQTPGATFSRALSCSAYLGGDEVGLFGGANKLAEGSRGISGPTSREVCVSGTASATPAQVQAIKSGTFYVGAEISGDGTSGQTATIRYETKRFELRLSGSVLP